MRSINNLLKIIIDYIIVFFCLFILLIPILIISILIYFFDGGNIFFIQERAGQYGKKIKIIKFKTLIKHNDKNTISKLGKFLRITRLDEIPQLINILKGEISFVGPRPLYLKYIPLYSKDQKRRLEMKPGITGWAQINGDNNISWKKKFQLDIWYINNFNILVDIKIILHTVLFFINNIFFYNKLKNKKLVIEEEFNGKN
tara:strand:+ start:105 stop:704 length:600 start_codon:yes stop_codon:yes gene_type:complete